MLFDSLQKTEVVCAGWEKVGLKGFVIHSKIGICKKEARETKHWLRMIAMAVPELKDESRKLWQEAKELNLIFNSIVNKIR